MAGGINNPNSAFGYTQSSGGDTVGGDFLAVATITKGNLVQFSATTATSVIPALTDGLATAIVGIALDNAVSGRTVRVAEGGVVDAIKDASVIVTAGHVVLRSATTVGQLISTAAVLTFPGQNLGHVIVGATAVAGTVRIYFNQV